MEVDAVVSRSNIELDTVTFGPNVGLGVDAYRSNIKFDVVASRPTMELGPSLVPVQSRRDVGPKLHTRCVTYKDGRGEPDKAAPTFLSAIETSPMLS
ncbi:hypothetical protein NC651_033542 [Populus alba x Populus x berolinensis]|nr:hypothetical protein NC651_033542 [Populus alba x Populus x berolinensis]